MLWMCVLYVSFGSKVRPRTFGCVAMGSEVLFILRSRLLLYYAGSGVNRVQAVIHVFSVILFGFVQAKTVCRYGCMYFLAALVLVCDGSYVSEPDKTVIFLTIGQSIPTKQQTTNTTPTKQGRTNGRCTGNNKHCTHRGNIHTKEDFNRNYSPSTCTQENNGGRHGRYQHTHRIDDNVVPNKCSY